MEENKELEDFIRKSVKEVGMEKPSLDFTDTVLSKIDLESQKNFLEHKPLFSKTVWFMVLNGVVLIFGYVILGGANSESSWLAAIQLNKLTYFNLSLNMPKFTLPAAAIYGSVAIALFVWIQVLLLKQYHFKKAYN